MKLTYMERFTLPQIYPEKGDMTEQLVVKDLLKKIPVPTIKELQEAGMTIPKEGEQIDIRWDTQKELEFEVELTQVELDFLKRRVDELNKQKNVTQKLLGLCLKIKDYSIKED